MRIALDAMGGDVAPQPNIDGAIAALDAHPNLEILLVGDQALLEKLLSQTHGSQPRLKIVPSEGIAEMGEKPMEALLKKPNCSIAICWKLMAAKEVDAVVSAGSTGAVVAAGLRTRLFLKGVKRPGIAVPMPTLKGVACLLDVGANPQARPEHLCQYGVMGAIYSREVLGVADPAVGLMNIGSEDGKGNELVREAHQLLSSSMFKGRYLGNIEGRDLFYGAADVIVCEGFVGNVLLKASEGMAEMMMQRISHEIVSRLDGEKHIAVQAFKDLTRKYSYHESGGAPLLGVDGICMICHGSSNGHSIANAMRAAINFKDRGINSQIVEQLADG